MPIKYDHREISELSGLELVQAYQNCLQAEAKRLEAAKHPKFGKMELPPVSPLFLELKSELHKEMTKRKLEINNDQ